MNIHQHCTMYKSNLKMQKYRRTIFQNCTKISNLSNFNRDILKQPFFRYSMKQKEKEEAKRILPFFPLQSSILRRKKLQTRQRLTLTLTLSLTKYLQSLETKSTKKRERKKKKASR